MLILVTGGAGSGKSQFAEQMAVRLHNAASSGLQPEYSSHTRYLYYFATMQIYDAECQQRVEKHQKQRAGKGFVTIEMPYPDYPDVSVTDQDTGLLECMGNLLANVQFDAIYCNNRNITSVPEYLTEQLLYLEKKMRHLVIVTNTVFCDRIPQDTAMQDYLRYLGEINCRLAERAEAVIALQSGIPVIWKGMHVFHENCEISQILI